MNQDPPIAGPIVRPDEPRDGQLPDGAGPGAVRSRPGVRVTLRSLIVWITTFAIVLSVYVNWRLVSFAVLGVAMGLATLAFIMLAAADWLERRVQGRYFEIANLLGIAGGMMMSLSFAAVVIGVLAFVLEMLYPSAN